MVVTGGETLETALFLTFSLLWLFGSAIVYYMTGDHYALNKEKKRLGLVEDSGCHLPACLAWITAHGRRKKWERENRFFTTDAYGRPEPDWQIVKPKHAPRQEWQRLPRGDRPNHKSVIAKAVAKMKTMVIEEQLEEIVSVAAMLAEQEMAANRLHALKQRALEHEKQNAQEIRRLQEQELRMAQLAEEREVGELQAQFSRDNSGAPPPESYTVVQVEETIETNSDAASTAPSEMSERPAGRAGRAKRKHGMAGKSFIRGKSFIMGKNTNKNLERAAPARQTIVRLNQSNPVPVAFIKSMMQKVDREGLHLEFKSIPFNRQEEGNPRLSHLNRSSSMFPTTHTRVVLKRNGDEAATYINANYIRGYNGQPEKYILTQGPLDGTERMGKKPTIGAFWQMIWDNYTKHIVTLTPVETQMCAPFFPTSKNTSVKCGPFAIYFERTSGSVDLQVHHIHIRNRGTEETRDLRHSVVTSYDEDGFPKSSSDFLLLVHKIQAAKKRAPEPVVVVDALGSGLGAVFIALEHGVSNIDSSSTVDVVRIVANIREDRGGSIETFEQYCLLYRCLCMHAVAMDGTERRDQEQAKDDNKKTPPYVNPPDYEDDMTPEAERALSKALDNELDLQTPDKELKKYSKAMLKKRGLTRQDLSKDLPPPVRVSAVAATMPSQVPPPLPDNHPSMDNVLQAAPMEHLPRAPTPPELDLPAPPPPPPAP